MNDSTYKKILSVSVMAHPSREKFFPYLKEKLGDVPFSIDEKSEGVWPNARRAWSMFDPDAAYHAVIQDDAVVCEKFLQRAEGEIIKANEKISEYSPAISFYFGNRGTLKGIANEGLAEGFCIMPRTPWAVAICLPTAIIPEMLETAETYPMPQDDVRIGKFLLSKGIRVYFPLPSLVSHRTGEDSLVGDPGKGREAHFFIDNK